MHDTGVRISETEYATELRRQLTTYDSDQQSSRNQLNATVERADDHLSDDDVEYLSRAIQRTTGDE